MFRGGEDLEAELVGFVGRLSGPPELCSRGDRLQLCLRGVSRLPLPSGAVPI